MLPPASMSAPVPPAVIALIAPELVRVTAPPLEETPGVLQQDRKHLRVGIDEGLDELRSAIARHLRGGNAEADSPASTGARCRDSLKGAATALGSASQTLRDGGGEELVAFDLRLALDELGKVVGAVVTDDILDRIFQRFCIGK
jgi:tRNA U34 5-carboxymethylaminomethyl modifying GTPase MnmE/TrmE